MPKIAFNTYQRTSTCGLWVKCRDGSYRCGNVKVKRGDKLKNGCYPWYLFLLVNGNWKRFAGRQRLHGYGHHADAKNGATKISKPVFEGLKL